MGVLGKVDEQIRWLFRMIWCDIDMIWYWYWYWYSDIDIDMCWLKEIWSFLQALPCRIFRAPFYWWEPKTHTSSSTSSWGSGRIPRKINLEKHLECGWVQVYYHLLMTNTSPWKPWPIEIDGLPSYKILKMGGFSMAMLNNQRLKRSAELQISTDYYGASQFVLSISCTLIQVIARISHKQSQAVLVILVSWVSLTNLLTVSHFTCSNALKPITMRKCNCVREYPG